MKLLVELLLCILHPLAVVLMWINLASRSDLSTFSKLVWAIFGLIPLVPFLYVLTGGALYVQPRNPRRWQAVIRGRYCEGFSCFEGFATLRRGKSFTTGKLYRKACCA